MRPSGVTVTEVVEATGAELRSVQRLLSGLGRDGVLRFEDPDRRGAAGRRPRVWHFNTLNGETDS
jgi:DNA-binding IclR family transcriptional regulator